MLRALKRLRYVSWMLILLLLWDSQWSLVQAASHSLPGATARQAAQANPAAPQAPARDELRFDALLSELKDALQQKPAVAMRRVLDLQERLGEEYDKVRAYFNSIETMINDKGSSDEIRQQHVQSVQAYEAKYATLLAHLQDIESAESDPLTASGVLALEV